MNKVEEELLEWLETQSTMIERSEVLSRLSSINEDWSYCLQAIISSCGIDGRSVVARTYVVEKIESLKMLSTSGLHYSIRELYEKIKSGEIDSLVYYEENRIKR